MKKTEGPSAPSRHVFTHCRAPVRKGPHFEGVWQNLTTWARLNPALRQLQDARLPTSKTKTAIPSTEIPDATTAILLASSYTDSFTHSARDVFSQRYNQCQTETLHWCNSSTQLAANSVCKLWGWAKNKMLRQGWDYELSLHTLCSGSPSRLIVSRKSTATFLRSARNGQPCQSFSNVAHQRQSLRRQESQMRLGHQARRKNDNKIHQLTMLNQTSCYPISVTLSLSKIDHAKCWTRLSSISRRTNLGCMHAPQRVKKTWKTSWKTRKCFEE